MLCSYEAMRYASRRLDHLDEEFGPQWSMSFSPVHRGSLKHWLPRFSRIPVYEVRFDNIIGTDISLGMVRIPEIS